MPPRGLRFRRLPLLALGAGLMFTLGLRGDTNLQARVQRIGSQIICTCGCNQGALECAHIDCPVKQQMRAEIEQRAQSPDSDALILQSFVQEYGTQVLANPTASGFNLLAWVMPWVALGVGLLLVLRFVQRWRLAHGSGSNSGPGAPAEASQVQQVQAEIAAALEKEWGPDAPLDRSRGGRR